MSIKRVTVFAASSQALDTDYINAAGRLGRTLAEAHIDIVYGGGSHGLMGAMADGALAAGGKVFGIIPEFLTRVEKGHQGITNLEIVNDMRTRKACMLDDSDAVITLPGGCGTFEELFEVMTLKRLGQFLGPIILVNTNNYYNGLVDFLQQSIRERFMNRTHLDLWQVIDQPENVIEALSNAPGWSSDRLQQAAVRRTSSK